ncbi:hypothetical protein SARC_02858 [Sphaeroforma arctica JP610]|uniref:Uncharacterized protein n=1 Tax=Sphaeroforma arctica JP610 TaxID=667725 RepID=A0A0L0G7R7_9EUKA|nr:hypothetical protein SARC_02858 [Sphaeroforma arctica JP610]KNC84936.1 hypothetical protein SARC_02858 [Sphaeroforma arctica JP610]|eukprot:XP_014158838.1 hypothetical protein SARC_02858 [Sphaeroforma arctica JP610]
MLYPLRSTPPPDQEFGHSAKQSPAEAQRPMYCKLGLSETIHALVADNEVHNAKAVGMVWLSLSADTVRELIERLNKGTPVAMVMELYLLGPYKFSATNPNRTVLDSVNQNFPSKLQIRLQASNLRSKLDQAAVAGGTTLPILQYDVMTKNTTEKDRRSLVPLVGSAEWRQWQAYFGTTSG